MTKARIYRPDKTAMQSGKAKDQWLLEFVSETPIFVDSLMGWEGMTDMTREIRMFFPTLEAAVAYAERENIPYEAENPNPRKQVRKAYADNFRANKRH